MTNIPAEVSLDYKKNALARDNLTTELIVENYIRISVRDSKIIGRSAINDENKFNTSISRTIKQSNTFKSLRGEFTRANKSQPQVYR